MILQQADWLIADCYLVLNWKSLFTILSVSRKAYKLNFSTYPVDDG